jgi:outer membrane protein assembly factor BamB
MRFLLPLLLLPALAFSADPPAYRVLAADQSTGKVAIINTKGEVEWEMPNKHNVHDLHMLDNGNILTHTSNTTVVEIDIKTKEVVWKYEAQKKEGSKRNVEVHSFQRLANGDTMVAESGNTRIVEVSKEGKIVKEVALKVAKPDSHRDTRMVRKLASGNYLVCHEGEGAVKEYDPKGEVVWEYKLDLGDRKASGGHGPEGHGTEVYGAVRLESGNTLIAGGNNNRVLEVDPKGKVVWSVDQKELDGITLAWVTTLQVLPNGNVIIGNCHATDKNPQLIEVTREKKVVWQFKDFKNFGDSLASAQVLGVKGVVR